MNRTTPLLTVLAGLAIAACADGGPAEPLAPSTTAGSHSSTSPALLSCPASTAVTVSDTIDALGGTLRVVDTGGGTHEIVFPAGALSVATVFTVTLPESQYLKARITATVLGSDVPLATISFPSTAQPALSISLARCGSGLPAGKLALYNVDVQTEAVLQGPFGQRAGGSSGNRVEGRVPHFSDWLIGAP